MTLTKLDGRNFLETTPISFSKLREVFVEDTGVPISMSSLYRNINPDVEDPIVPDAAENSNIPTSGPIQLSKFRGSIKGIVIEQTGEDINVNTNSNTILNLFGVDNLSKNIRKNLIVKGIIGSNNASSPALYHNSASYKNISFNITSTGAIYGAGGSAGSANGGNGGTAVKADYKLKLINSGKIYAGGGGGGAGSRGGTGGTGGQGTYTEFIKQTCTRTVAKTCSRPYSLNVTSRSIGFSGAIPVGGYPYWSSFMNNYAVSFRTSNANGAVDTSEVKYIIAPAAGYYTVTAAADNASAGCICDVKGVKCSIGGLSSGGMTTQVYFTKNESVGVAIRINNAFEPVASGGNNFSTNPMGLAFTITGSGTEYYDCSYIESYDCSVNKVYYTDGGAGGSGGTGGNGGRGRGYDYQFGGLTGLLGNSGSSGSSGGRNAGSGGTGGIGGNGGSGGDWGQDGSPGNLGGSGSRGSDGNYTGGSAGSASPGGAGNLGAAGKSIEGDCNVTLINNGDIKGPTLNISSKTFSAVGNVDLANATWGPSLEGSFNDTLSGSTVTLSGDPSPYQGNSSIRTVTGSAEYDTLVIYVTSNGTPYEITEYSPPSFSIYGSGSSSGSVVIPFSRSLTLLLDSEGAGTVTFTAKLQRRNSINVSCPL